MEKIMGDKIDEIQDSLETFSYATRQWVGDSPKKAAAFGFVCAALGYLVAQFI
jgi:hypothetical protein